MQARALLDHRVCDAEVQQLDVASGRDQHVLRGNVAVDDAQRIAAGVGELMRVAQGMKKLADHEGDHRGAHVRVVDQLESFAQAHEVDALDPLHDEKTDPAVFPLIEHLHDVGVAHQAGDLGLGPEHAAVSRLSSQVRQDHLDRDGPPSARGFARQPDFGHAASARLPDELVAPDDIVGGECRSARTHRSRLRATVEEWRDDMRSCPIVAPRGAEVKVVWGGWIRALAAHPGAARPVCGFRANAGMRRGRSGWPHPTCAVRCAR